VASRVAFEYAPRFLAARVDGNVLIRAHQQPEIRRLVFRDAINRCA
jgi:hypothetical protein